MKAAHIHEHGTADVIRYEDVPTPAPGAGEVLIKVAAASHNPSDVGFRAGLMRDLRPLPLPYIPGVDVSGTVSEVGAGVTALRVGDPVIGLLDHGGACAEYAVGIATSLVRAPRSVPLADAAAIPVAGLTAWQALFERAELRAGQRVLINGAGGGVGMFAVQLARRAGATVIATASPRSADAVRRFGAHEVVDHTAVRLADALDAPVDAVVNLAAMAPDAVADLAFLVRPGGVLVSITVPVEPPAGTDVTTRHMITRNDPGQLATLVGLVDAGELAVEVSEVYPLADLALAHRRSEAGRTRGKLIVVP
jgi:NADPH:quinone reductase-like Zn-dependent oxidoreductase